MSAKASRILAYCLASLVLLTPALFFLAENGKINAFSTYLLALLMIPALVLPDLRKHLAGQATAWWATAGLLVYLGISATWAATDRPAAYLGYGLLILAFMGGCVISTRRFAPFQRYLLVTIAGCATLSALLSIYLHFALPEYQPLPEPRLFGFGRLENPAIAAMSYGFAVTVTGFLLLQSRDPGSRIIAIACLSALLTAVVLTGTRSVWPAIGVSLGIGMALQFRQRGFWIFAGTVALVGLVGAMALGWEELTRRALSFRPEIWSEFIRRTLDANVLFGMGSGTDSHWVHPELTFQHPHSIFVSAFYFGGMIGLVMLFALYAACVRGIWCSEISGARQLAAMALAYGFMIGIFDGDNVVTKVNHLWWVLWLPVSWCLCLDDSRSIRTSGDHPAG